MNRIQPIVLILLGLIWLFYSVMLPMASKTAAMSDAMQLESDLKNWADSKVREGKLENEDVLEIFPKNYSLKLGGENPNHNFREMVADIATRNPLPTWPGILLLGLGTWGLFRPCRTKQIQSELDNA